LAFIKKTNGSYEKEFSEYLNKLEIALARSKKIYNRVYSALDVIQNETVRAVVEYYYIHNNNHDDTCQRFSYSHSSICRYKKVGLSKIAEQLFGIIIEERSVGEKYYPEDEFAV
jgi:DNA-directed RNA polymerase specialized sigma subunit